MWNEAAWFALAAAVALKSSAVWGAAWLAARLMRGGSAAARHLVWSAAAAVVVALPLLSPALPAWALPGPLAYDMGAVFRTSVSGHGIGSAAQASAVRLPRKTAPPASRPLPDWRLTLLLLWAAGSLLASIQTINACRAMRRLRRSAEPSPNRDLARELAAKLGIRRRVEVLRTAAGTMPMTFGMTRPEVFLPQDAEQWTAERLRVVLLHELAHVRRGDARTQTLGRIALILNWWNPLAWKAWKELLKERERAADDLVLQAGTRASDYAGHLLEVARAMRTQPALPWAAVAMARRPQLEGRLTAILDSRVNRGSAGGAPAWAAMSLAALIVVPLAAVRAQNKLPETAPAEVEATIRSAIAQKNYETLDRPALALEAVGQYEDARKLLDAGLAIRAEVSGQQSAVYGVGLMKLGDLEKKRHRRGDAAGYYSRAVEALREGKEAARALIYLGTASMAEKNLPEAMDYFGRAKDADPTRSGAALMWMAVVRQREGNSEEAEKLYRDALALENPQTPEAGTTRKLYAAFLREQGREDEAGEMDRPVAAAAAQKPDRSASVYRIGGSVSAPAVLYKVEPEYTDEARAAELFGTEVVYVEIGVDGMAHNIQVLSGLGLGLDENGVEALQKWRFKPGVKDGQAVPVMATIEINWRLM